MYSKKTKFVCLILSFVMIFSIVNLQPQNSYAESYSTSGILGGRFRWKIDSNKTFTIQGEGYINPLDFDDEEGNIYRAISEAEKVIIKEGIKNIPENFLCETQMKTLILPDTLEEIASYGINSLYLKSLHISKNMHKLGTNAIMCPNLKQFTVASDNPYFTTVGGVLYNKSKTILVRYPAAMNLTTYYIPENVYKIATGAFYDCRLHRIIMPDTVAEIGHYAFTSSKKLTYIRLSNNLEGISGLAFGDCEKLQSIELPDSIEYIKGEAFYSCDNLSFIKMSKNIIEIGEQAFSNCTSLKKIDLPLELLTLGEHVFAFSGITEIKIPNNVTYISSGAFYNCESLKAVYLPNNLKQIKNHAFCYCTALTYIDIPDSVNEIQEAAFSSCENLASVHLPDNISKINPHTFNHCEKLSNINLPASITEIGEGAFLGCISIKTMTLPRNVTTIGESAFSGCRNFESVFIPKSVTIIERGAFNGTGLKNVQYDGTAEQWNAISISSNNTRLFNAYKGYTVNFYTNDGNSDVYLTQMVSYGDYIVAPEKPTRDGYIFTGWYSNSSCTGEPYITSTGVSYRKPNSNISLYAGWKKRGVFEWGKDTKNRSFGR